MFLLTYVTVNIKGVLL